MKRLNFNIKSFSWRIYKLLYPIVNKIKKYFRSIEKDILYLDWGIDFEEYIALMLFFSLISFILSFILIILVMFVLFKYIDIFLIFLSLLFSISIFFLVFIYFYSYPKLAKTDYIKEIEDNLPLFLLYFYGLVSSGMNPLSAIKVASKRKEFGKLSKELKFLTYLSEQAGYDFLSSLDILAKKTPSKMLKEVLYELVSVIRSGGDIRETVKILAKNYLADYELKLKSFIEKSSFLLTLYTFLFIAFPLTLLVLAFLFAIASGNAEIIKNLDTFLLGFIPLGYIIYLYIIYLIQPSI